MGAGANGSLTGAAAVFLRSATLHFGKLRCITVLFRFWVFPDCTFLDISTRAIEADTGRPAVTAENAAQLNAVVTDVIEGVAEADKPNEDEK